MASWVLTAQLTSGTLVVGSTDRIWWNGIAFGTNVVVAAFQDTTHVSNTSDAHLCTSHHVNNTKRLSGTTLSLNGGGSSNLSALTQADAGLKFTFSDSASVATSNASFYAYDGTTDATAMSGVDFYAAEAEESSTWIEANGSGNALTLADQGASTSHDFYIATSISPTSTGSKTGKIKAVLTYV